jgi:hypothetical protein
VSLNRTGSAAIEAFAWTDSDIGLRRSLGMESTDKVILRLACVGHAPVFDDGMAVMNPGLAYACAY